MINERATKILKREGPPGPKEMLWKGQLDGFEAWVPTEEDVIISLNDTSSVAVCVWENEEWVPTKEQLDKGLKTANYAIRRAVLRNPNWIIDKTLLNNLLQDGEPFERLAMWGRSDWSPSAKQIDEALSKETLMIKQAIWGREDWSPEPKHLDLMSPYKADWIFEEIWKHPKLKFTELQLIDALSSNSLNVAKAAFERPDWVHSKNILSLGLDNKFKIKSNAWEKFRPELEALLLKEKHGVIINKNTLKAL